jgi:archaellum component FlaF (FlaF/FlaG flagellin family)
MGFSISAATAIIVSSMLFCGIVLYNAANSNFNSVKTDANDAYDWNEDRKDTDIIVDSLWYNKSSNILRVSVLNNGETTLLLKYLDIILDGYPRTDNISGFTAKNSTGVYVSTNLSIPTKIFRMAVNITNIGLTYDPNADPRKYASADTNLTNPGNISAAADRVYIVDDNSHIDIFTLKGVFKKNMSDDVVSVPKDISVTSRYIFVLNDTNSVYRFDLDGSNRQGVVVSEPVVTIPTSIFATEDYLYVVNNTNEIYRFTHAGGSRTLLNNTKIPNDIYVTDYIYIINNSANVVRFTLDGKNATDLISSSFLSSPTNLAVTDEDFGSKGKIYVSNNSAEIAVFDLNGAKNSTITAGLSDNIFGVDATAKIYVTDKNNGLVIENLGSILRIITENGVPSTVLI